MSRRPPESILRRALPTRVLALAAVLLALLAVARLDRAWAQTPRADATAKGGTVAPAVPEIPADLLSAQPFDKLTLTDNAAFLIEPVSPRPLPPPRAADTKLAADAPPGEGANKNDDKLEWVVIHLLEGDQRDFRVKRISIRSVEYWEDMLLAEAEKLVLRRNFAKAFEYLLAVQARNPRWKGLNEAVDRLLFEEGSWALAGNERARGIRLLRELYARRPDYPGLSAKLAESFGSVVEGALQQGDYAYGRKVLHELTTIAPESTVISDLKTRYGQRASELAEKAASADGAAARLDLLTQSLRVWPDQQETPERFAEAFRATPTLEVGVIDVPRPVAPWINSRAAARVAPLLFRPILVDDSDEAMTGVKGGQVAQSVELADLGRRLDIRLNRNLLWSDGSRRLAAIDVVRALSDRAQPRSPGYNARWADLLDRIETVDAETVSVRLKRSPLVPAAWLLFPVGPAHASWDGRVALPEGRLPVGDGAFRFRSGSNDGVELAVRPLDELTPPEGSAADAAPAPASPPTVPKIARVREVRLADATAALTALERGDISILELVPPDRVELLKQAPEVKVGQYRLPALHHLAVDGRNPILRNRSLRRGLAAAIDRKLILEENVLRRPIDDANRPSDGVYAADSDLNAPNVNPIDFNPLLARMLVVAARRELAVDRIRLTLEYPARPDVRAAIPRMIEQLRNVGLEVEAVERSESELEQGLRAGKRFDLAYRVARTSDPILELGPMLCPGYDAAPDSQGLAALASARTLQLLLQLEHAPDFATARELATLIDRECRDELPILPLWQLREHYAWRTRLKGPAEVADTLYQGLERWEIEPWFARDPW